MALTPVGTRRPTDAGSASALLADLLGGPERPARVLGRFPSAVYLAPAGASAMALLTADAVRLPNAVVLAGRAVDGALAATGDPPAGGALVGAGRVVVGGLTVRVTRWWTPRRATVPVSIAELRRGRDALAATLRAGAVPLPTAVDERLRQLVDRLTAGGPVDALASGGCAEPLPPRRLVASVAVAERLLGLGPGLTPAGDDVLAGLLLGLRHLGGSSGAALAAALGAGVLPAAERRTTAISAALLRHAAGGAAADPVIDVLDAVGGRLALAPALRRLLAVGHTSGADLATGLLAGATVALAYAGSDAGPAAGSGAGRLAGSGW